MRHYRQNLTRKASGLAAATVDNNLSSLFVRFYFWCLVRCFFDTPRFRSREPARKTIEPRARSEFHHGGPVTGCETCTTGFVGFPRTLTRNERSRKASAYVRARCRRLEEDRHSCCETPRVISSQSSNRNTEDIIEQLAEYYKIRDVETVISHE